MNSQQNETGLTLEDLAVNHPYYCNENNYYSNAAALKFETCQDFLAEFASCDIDLNYCFRWDVALKDESNPNSGYKAQVFMMLQRKGIFMPIRIHSIFEEDVDSFVTYLQKHADYHDKLWNPIV